MDVLGIDVEEGERYSFPCGVVDGDAGKWERRAGELLLYLLTVVYIDVCITEGVDELAGNKVALLGHHHQEESVGCDVEGNAKEEVCASLVELEVEILVAYVELEEAVAGREGHFVELGRIPCGDDVAAGGGVVLDGFDDSGDLIYIIHLCTYPVYACAVIAAICHAELFPITPLRTIHRSEISVLVCPSVPDVNAFFDECIDVCVATDHPKEFGHDTAPKDFLGGDERESVCEVEAELAAKDGKSSGACAVIGACAIE